MKKERLNTLIRQAEERKLKLRQQKGEEYTRGDEDPLKNFKRVAEGCGLTPMQAWFVYASKHFDAIANYVKTGQQKSDEPIAGRIDDLQVYLDLFRGLVDENEPHEQACFSDSTPSCEIPFPREC